MAETRDLKAPPLLAWATVGQTGQPERYPRWLVAGAEAVRMATQELVVAPLDPMTVEQIEALRGVLDGWDGEGSAAPSGAAIARLEGFCRALALLSVTPESIDPDTIGGAGATIGDPKNDARFCYVLFSNSGKTHMSAQGGNVRGYNLTHSVDGDGGMFEAMRYVQVFLGRDTA